MMMDVDIDNSDFEEAPSKKRAPAKKTAKTTKPKAAAKGKGKSKAVSVSSHILERGSRAHSKKDDDELSGEELTEEEAPKAKKTNRAAVLG